MSTLNDSKNTLTSAHFALIEFYKHRDMSKKRNVVSIRVRKCDSQIKRKIYHSSLKCTQKSIDISHKKYHFSFHFNSSSRKLRIAYIPHTRVDILKLTEGRTQRKHVLVVSFDLFWFLEDKVDWLL